MIMSMIRVTWLLNCCHRRVSQTYCKARGLWRWVVGVMMVAVAVAFAVAVAVVVVVRLWLRLCACCDFL